ncbi:MAG: FHA domain-containing protein [Candidatus Aminicenantia bacterium]
MIENFARIRASAWLEVLEGPRKGEKIFITSSGLSIGRKKENDLPLEDPMVSREHARIEQELSGFSIRDLGSKNGVFVNDIMVDFSPLKNGDIIRIGSSLFRFHMEEEEKKEEIVLDGKKEFVKKQKKGSPVRIMIYILTAFTLMIVIIALTFSKKGTPEQASEPAEERNVVKPITPSTKTTSDISSLTHEKKEMTEVEKVKFDSLFQQGEIAFFQGSYVDSISFYKQALEINPQCETCKKRIEEANKRLIDIIKEIDKRAHEFFESLQYERAIDEWQRILDIVKDPSNQFYIEASKNIEKAKERIQ